MPGYNFNSLKVLKLQFFPKEALDCTDEMCQSDEQLVPSSGTRRAAAESDFACETANRSGARCPIKLKIL
jgi:hypothetical protein